MTEFTIELPIPPSDNNLSRSGPWGKYPSKGYKEWLDLSAPLLRAALGNVEPDTTCWWDLHIRVWNRPRGGDTQNLLKAAADLLSGAQVTREGKIVRPGALYDDDKRVKRVCIELMGTHDPDARIILTATTTEPPAKWKAPKKARTATNLGFVIPRLPQ